MTIETIEINFCPLSTSEVGIAINDNLISLKDQELENILLAEIFDQKLHCLKSLQKPRLPSLAIVKQM